MDGLGAGETGHTKRNPHKAPAFYLQLLKSVKRGAVNTRRRLESSLKRCAREVERKMKAASKKEGAWEAVYDRRGDKERGVFKSVFHA
eukprot:6203787-Pleurochrysis_carterae.AAC.6